MSKNFVGDRTGEGTAAGDGDTQVIPRMITSQAVPATPGLPLTRPALALQTPGQQTYIVQPHHEMKNYGKPARPIAPAPPTQPFQSLTPRSASQASNIPSIITPSLGAPAPGTGGSSETATAMGTVGHSPMGSVTVSLSQASVLTLGNPAVATPLGNTATIVQQGVSAAAAAAIPINMLRAASAVAQPQPQMQTLQGLSHLSRGSTTLSVPKSPALLRQGTPAAAGTTLQIPGSLAPALSLPLARPPLLQTIKTSSAQVARPLSPAVGAQPQAQDLSRASFPPTLHGSITPASQGQHAMHITLNPRLAAPTAVTSNLNPQAADSSSNRIQQAANTVAVTTGVSLSASLSSPASSLSSSSTSQVSDISQAQPPQRINVSLSQESAPAAAAPTGPIGVHHHIHHPLNNPHHHHHQHAQPHQQAIGRSSTLPFSGPVSCALTSNKLQPHLGGFGQPAKVIPSHALQQQVAAPSIKSVNLAVPSPVMINSINPGTIPICIASSVAPIPIAKVTPQRQVAGSIPLATASTHPHPSTSSISLSAPPTSLSSTVSVASTVSTLPTAMAISSLPTSLPISLSSLSSSSSLTAAVAANLADSSSSRPEHPGLSVSQSSNGGIIITPDFQGRTPGTIIPMTSLAASSHGNTAPTAVSHTENRPGGPSQPQQQQIGIGPEDSMWYQHIVYQHVSQTATQPGGPTIVRPGPNAFAFLPTQGKVQGGASGLSGLPASSASPSLRFSNVAAAAAASGGTMMVVDPMRQQQQQHHQGTVLHPAFSGALPGGLAVAEKLASLASRQTVASGNVYTASVGVQSQVASGGGQSSVQSSGLSAVPVSNPSSSPRPSILRKRTSETTGVMVRKPNFNLNQDHRCHSPPRVDTAITTTSSSSPTPKISTKNFSPMSENSQSSTDTALSSNDATTPTNNHNEKSKVDGDDSLENGPMQSSTVNNIPASPAVSHTGSLSEASPRKRARKQSLHANEELKDNSSSEDEIESTSVKKRDDVSKEQRLREKEIEKHGEYTDEDGVRWTLHKPKPTFVLLQPEIINNKTKNNHFMKYTDVKPREERRPTVNELSNQKGIMQKVNGWKLYFSDAQLQELEDFEKEMQCQFSEVQNDLSKAGSHKSTSEETLKIHEISQANIQRCELIQTQLKEARAAMLRTLDHQPRIHQILNKHMSKRPIKKKERT